MAPGDGGQNISFEFGETAASNAFWDRNPKSFPALMRLVGLTNKAFGREWKPKDRMQDIRIDAKRQAVDALDAARRSEAANGTAGNGNGEAANAAEIETVVEVSDDLTSQSAVERVPALR